MLQTIWEAWMTATMKVIFFCASPEGATTVSLLFVGWMACAVFDWLITRR